MGWQSHMPSAKAGRPRPKVSHTYATAANGASKTDFELWKQAYRPVLAVALRPVIE